MKILETKVSDSGLYVCVASNIAGNLTQSIELSILGKLESFVSWTFNLSLPSCGY